MEEDLNLVAKELEKQELQVQGGVAPPQLYTKLLAIYLYQNDLCNAKFLWRRVPQTVKAAHPELGQVWAVGRSMWQRDAPAVYQALSNTQWSENVAPIMKALIGIVRDRAINLISQAYASLNVTTLVSLLGLPEAEALEAARSQGWKIEGDIIFPNRPIPPSTHTTSSEDQLHKLTDFVAFLEN